MGQFPTGVSVKFNPALTEPAETFGFCTAPFSLEFEVFSQRQNGPDDTGPI